MNTVHIVNCDVRNLSLCLYHLYHDLFKTAFWKIIWKLSQESVFNSAFNAENFMKIK